MQTILPECFKCKWFHHTDVKNDTCDAFPEGIPSVIFFEAAPHHTPWQEEPVFTPLSNEERLIRMSQRKVTN